MQPSSQQLPQMHLFFTQKQTLKRTNITVIDMNKSKIKFLNKYLSKSQMSNYTTSTASNSQINNTTNNNKNSSSINLQQSSPNPIEQYNLQFRMKDKFQDLYKRIMKISGKQEIRGKYQKRYYIAPNQEINGKKQPDIIHHQLLKLGYRPKFKNNSKILEKEEQKEDYNVSEISVPLEINTTSTDKKQQAPNIHILSNTRYRARLVSLNKPSRMSNNIADYLSVQKIRLQDLQNSIVQKQHNIILKNKLNKQQKITLYNQLSQSLSNGSMLLPAIDQRQQLSKTNIMKTNANKNLIKLRNKKFQPCFQTYYYRDLLWRVAYSNQKILEFPQEYQYKIRVFVGRGNNSRLVRSIITRRPWYQITQKIQQAHVIWTQIKVQSIFASQPKIKYERQDKDRDKIRKNDKNQLYIPGSIWTHHQQKYFKKYFNAYRGAQAKMTQNMKFRNRTIHKLWQKLQPIEQQSKNNHNNKADLISNSMPVIISSHQQTLSIFQNNNINKIKIHNHFINSYLIGNKKALFQTMSDYYTKKGDDVFNYLPLTFHITNGFQDQKYSKFLNYYYAIAKKAGEDNNRNSKFNAWIVKPGENTNRGQGITVCLTLQSIRQILKRKDRHIDGSYKTYIVQKYIQRPMLYKRRKFDIRHYIMINCSNGYVKGYWFRQGYVRTTSSQYTLKQGFGSVHLTNDAVQKNLPDYGKFQKGNKISYDQLEAYLTKLNNKWSFWEQAYPRMKKIATDVIRASASNLDPDRRTNFQIYGLDFMIDDQMHVWLIQVNTNPCLQLSCPLLAKIIPKMVQQTLQICLDPLYPPPINFNPKSMTFQKNCVQQMQYQLVYDDRFEQFNKSDSQLLNDQSLKKQQDDCFEDDGQDWNQD